MQRIITRFDALRSTLLSVALPQRTATGQNGGARLGGLTSVNMVFFGLAAALLPAGTAIAAVTQEETTETQGAADTPNAAVTQYVLAEGQITDQMGSGLGGVTITLHRAGSRGQDAGLLATTTSDGLGDFVLSAPKPLRGKVTVTFTKPMFATLTREVEIGGEDLPYLGESMQGDLTVTGRVIHGLTEKPIAGATVEATSREEGWTATTDAGGRFELRGVSPGNGEVSVSAKGFGHEREVIPSFLDAGALELRLMPERLVHIKVVDDAGKPVRGVVVESLDREHDDTRSFASDDKGLVDVDAVHFDTSVMAFRLTHDDYVSDVDFSRTVSLPKDKTVSTHVLKLARAGTITGRVTDASGKPIHSARAMTGDTYSDNSPRNWTSDTGTYTIHGVKPGTVTVTVHAPGFAPELRIVSVEAGHATTADVSLSKGTTVRGRVEDANGHPVKGIYLATGVWRDRSTLGLQAMSDAQGGFTLNDAPRDTFELTASPKTGDPITKSVRGSSGQLVTFAFPVEPVRSGPIGSEGLKIGDVAPAVEITALDGTVIKTGDQKGKVILLDFWATWCAPCLDEMPNLISVWNKYRSRDDFIMVGMSRDFDAPTLEGFLERSDAISWPQAVGSTGGVEKAVRLFGVTWIPRVYLIDRDGKIIGKNLRGDDIMKALDELFHK